MNVLYKKPEVKSYSAGDILEELGPCQNQYNGSGTQEYTTTFYTTTGNSSVNVDGHVWNTGSVVTGSTIVPGDNVLNEDSRGFVGFDISSIPTGSTIVSATLRVYQWFISGDPYGDLGNLVVDHVNFGSSLDSSDYSGGTLTSDIETISSNATLEWKTLNVTSYVQADIDASRTSSQFRLHFSKTTDGNADSDRTEIESGEDSGGSGNRPELVVTYR